MGELIKILGTSEVPHESTALEKLAEEIAQNHSLKFDVQENGLVEQGWLYYYGRKGKDKKHTVMYDLHYFLGIECGPIIPFEEAKQKLVSYKESGNYDEQLSFFRGHRISFSIMYSPNLKLESGKYAVSFGGRHMHASMQQIRTLFEEAITCKFLKKKNK